ncbi:hypothetical protein [Nitrosococcus watsonii]|uniref:Uncharacterized protein n=1 Tax=Nitrosococcus watsoni (strain C-113) TaxID=105559 RepID=D8K7S6_NITWC|nr:hypothetical protein [Nitrosococcus watsonii]ADJ28953.1 hypothetical protein Nwat_2120 [Nitrosococcus watsonii C-113]
MDNGLSKVYALAVCFSSLLLCSAITLGFFLYNMVTIIAPRVTIDPVVMHYYRSNEAFRISPFYPAGDNRPAPIVIGPGSAMLSPAPNTDEAGSRSELTDKEIETLRSKRFEARLFSHREKAKQDIILQAIIILISSSLFIVHWKLAKKYPS